MSFSITRLPCTSESDWYSSEGISVCQNCFYFIIWQFFYHCIPAFLFSLIIIGKLFYSLCTQLPRLNASHCILLSVKCILNHIFWCLSCFHCICLNTFLLTAVSSTFSFCFCAPFGFFVQVVTKNKNVHPKFFVCWEK